jgi:hypothetical protein
MKYAVYELIGPIIDSKDIYADTPSPVTRLAVKKINGAAATNRKELTIFAQPRKPSPQ